MGVRVKPEELRAFADALHPADFSRVNGDLPAISLLSEMEETKDPNQFITAWAPHMVGLAEDFLRCIMTFRTVAHVAADGFEAADADHAAILRKLLNDARGDRQPTEPGDLSQLPHTRPPTGPLAPPEELVEDKPKPSNSPNGYNPYGSYGSAWKLGN